MNFENYSFKSAILHQKNVILIHFDYNSDLINALRKRFPSAKWSATKKSWYLPDLPSVREALNLKMRDAVLDKVSKILSSSNVENQLLDSGNHHKNIVNGMNTDHVQIDSSQQLKSAEVVDMGANNIDNCTDTSFIIPSVFLLTYTHLVRN